MVRNTAKFSGTGRRCLLGRIGHAGSGVRSAARPPRNARGMPMESQRRRKWLGAGVALARPAAARVLPAYLCDASTIPARTITSESWGQLKEGTMTFKHIHCAVKDHALLPCCPHFARSPKIKGINCPKFRKAGLREQFQPYHCTETVRRLLSERPLLMVKGVTKASE